MKRSLTALVVSLLIVAGGAATAEGAAYKRCRPVLNPYAGTRYEGVDLSHIRARRVSCRTARRVARRAHRKALGLTPPVSGIRRFRYGGWHVTGNLRGDHDRYVAKARGGKRVRWLF